MSSNILAPLQQAAATNDIRAIKPLVEIPNPWAWFWWTAAIALIAFISWRAWRRWKNRQTEAPPGIVIPAHERARQRLRQALQIIHEPRPFCIAVSDAVRLYLEDRFHLHAPDRTTEEFLDELQLSPQLTFDQKQTLGEFLQRCDLVKFARYEPTEMELRQLYEAAIRLIDETEPTFMTGANPNEPEATEPNPSNL